MTATPPSPDGELRRRLLRGGTWALGGKIFAALMQLVTAALAARLLNPASLGTYFIATTIALLLSMAARLGVDRIVVRLVSESRGVGRLDHARDAVRISVWLGIAGAIGIGGLSWPIVRLLGEHVFSSAELVEQGPLIALWVAVMGMQLLLAECFRGFEGIGAATWYGSVLPTGLTALCLIGLWMAAPPVTLGAVIAWSLVATAVPGVLAAGALIRDVSALPRSQTPGYDVRTVLVPSIPMLLNQMLAYALSNVGLWAVGAVLPEREAAIYGAALRLVQAVTMTLFVVNQVIPPFVAQLHATGDTKRLEYMVRISGAAAALPTITVIAVYVFLGGPLLSVLFGGVYAEGAAVLAILSLGQLGTMIVGSCAMVLSMTGQERVLMWSTVLATGTTFLLSLVGAHWVGAIGVAVVISITTTAQQLALFGITRSRLGVWTHADFPGLFRQASKLVDSLRARSAAR